MSTVPFSRRSQQSSDDAPLPNNLHAERCILGTVLLDNHALRQAREQLQPLDFFLNQHKIIFNTMLELADADSPIDTTLLMERLTAKGQLEAAGGIAYLSQLADGMPRVTNVAHYARIVSQKSMLRQLVHTAHLISERALDPAADTEAICAQFPGIAKSVNGHFASLATVETEEFLTLSLPPLEYVIEPLLSVRGRGMIYSRRGIGKTFVSMSAAYSIACGIEQCFMWRIPMARPVVYVDGEMHAAQLQQRLRQVMRIHDGRVPAAGMLRWITRDLQKAVRPKINTREGRSQIEHHLREGAVLILDNLSALAPSGDEAETDEWAEIEDWLIDLSWQGVSTIFVHHSGKSGEQRGTSKREDLLDFVLNLRVPSDYSVEEGLRVEAHLTKVRGQIPEKQWGAPFEISLRDDEWLTRPLKQILREQARKMLEAGMRPNDVAQETGLSRYQIYRLDKSRKAGSSEEIDL